MSRPTDANSLLILRNGDFSLRLARVGKGPLWTIWVHEDGRGGRGFIGNFDDGETLVESMNDLLDDFEEERGS